MSDQVPIPPTPPAIPPSPSPVSGQSSMSAICPQCHFPTKPEYYYCPNCGAKLTEPPLSTSGLTQAAIYAFSIVLPWIAYLAIGHWPGIKYMKSADERAKQIGVLALVLLVLSSIVAFWLTYVWIQSYIQESVNSINNLGNL